MADGALTLILDDETRRRLDEAAREAGVTPETFAAYRLGKMLEDGSVGSFDTTEALRRLEEYDRTGEYVDGERALATFVAEVKAQAATRR